MWRSERTESILRRLAAEFFQTPGGPTLITVTGCHLSSDGKRATIFLSALPKEQVLAAYHDATRRLSEFQEYVRTHARIHPIPFFELSLAEQGEK